MYSIWKSEYDRNVTNSAALFHVSGKMASTTVERKSAFLAFICKCTIFSCPHRSHHSRIPLQEQAPQQLQTTGLLVPETKRVNQRRRRPALEVSVGAFCGCRPRCRKGTLLIEPPVYQTTALGKILYTDHPALSEASRTACSSFSLQIGRLEGFLGLRGGCETMPVKGGAFFGFAIVIAVALITWGIIAIVNEASPKGDSDDGDEYTPPADGESDIQDALNDASPGDVIEIPAGEHYIDLITAVAGTEDEPITIRGAAGTTRDEVILKGAGDSRVVDIRHSWYIIEDFTIDGEIDDDEYRDHLLFVQGSTDPEEVDGEDTSITGVVIQNMRLRNAAEECLRIKYWVTNSVIQSNDIRYCGIHDYELGGGDSNGEGIYIGTASGQWYDDEEDVCRGNVVQYNYIETQGSEGVDIKEGSIENLVQYNEITGEVDGESGGIGVRGDYNVIRYNFIFDTVGACVRLGGNEEDGRQWGVNNEVYGNDLDGCQVGAVKIVEIPQIVCENEVTEPSDVDDWEAVAGAEADEFTLVDITGSCPDLMAIGVPFYADESLPIGGTDDFGDDEVTETDNDTTDDDTEEATTFGTDDNAGEFAYVGCFAEIDDVFESVVDDEDDMTPAVCVEECEARGDRYAALIGGSGCMCGNPVDYDVYDDGTCDSFCAGDSSKICGGDSSFSLYIVYYEGSTYTTSPTASTSTIITTTSTTTYTSTTLTDDQGDDTGGLGGDESGDDTYTDSTYTTTGTTPEAPSPTPEPVSPTPEPVSPTPEPETTSETTDDDTGGGIAEEVSGNYLGCFGDDDNYPILTFEYEDETTLTPQKCIDDCAEKGEELAGLQAGRQCWCGTTDDYDKYGASNRCNMRCTGDSSLFCGGDNDSMVYEVDP